VNLVQEIVKEAQFGPPSFLVGPFQLETSSPLTMPPSGDSTNLPGCRELDEDDTSLNVILDSLLPIIRETNLPI
jgi:hypothetical protein